MNNPPLLVVCDLDRFEVHTNFTGTAKRVHAFNLEGLAEPANLDILRKLFNQPEALRPGLTAASMTEQAAERFGQLADGMRVRAIEPQEAAHFLMKLMFCMFGEDVALLPEKVFTNILESSRRDPARLAKRLRSLFEAMTTGGDFGPVEIPWFNGGLFNDAQVVELIPAEIEALVEVNSLDWSSVEPSIFGTLFERTLDPAKRSQIGAHYTSKDDILTLLEPVMMQPLQREWAAVKEQADALWEKVRAASRKTGGKASRSVIPKTSKEGKKFEKLLQDFCERLAHVTVLDPACGSGNFLYVAIKLLLDLNKEVISYAAQRSLNLLPSVRPSQLAGIEINPYAQELASVVIWIGYLQWMHDNGFAPQMQPVLEAIETIELKDAILDLSDPKKPKEPQWPKADFIVGNPPFLGGSKLWEELGRDYQQSLFRVYEGRVPGFADLCCYWFERAISETKMTRGGRAGLLATQAIRGGANREVVERIKENGEIFFAISDRHWILDGANVHISMIGFDNGNETLRVLDGRRVTEIFSNLSSCFDASQSRRLNFNKNISFSGTKKSGDFNFDADEALNLLSHPNPHAKPNSDVIRPWVNGTAIVGRGVEQWIIDPGTEMAMEQFSKYELAFKRILERVKPARDINKREVRRTNWWLHAETCPAMRNELRNHIRYLATPRVSKHRVFAWFDSEVLCDDGVFVFARSDDYFFGVMHSRIHELWSLKLGTRLETRPRYTPTTCFETFPFPEPTDAQREEIAAAAQELDGLRNNWLNPPEWVREEVLEFPGTVGGPWLRYIDISTVPPGDSPGANAGIGTVKYPRLVPRDEACAKQLAKRTLTNLYNQRPTWLELAHQKLDAAVFAAYGWPTTLTDDELLAKLLELNLARAAAER